jgi:hypothetical protein
MNLPSVVGIGQDGSDEAHEDVGLGKTPMTWARRSANEEIAAARRAIWPLG